MPYLALAGVHDQPRIVSSVNTPSRGSLGLSLSAECRSTTLEDWDTTLSPGRRLASACVHSLRSVSVSCEEPGSRSTSSRYSIRLTPHRFRLTPHLPDTTCSHRPLQSSSSGPLTPPLLHSSSSFLLSAPRFWVQSRPRVRRTIVPTSNRNRGTILQSRRWNSTLLFPDDRRTLAHGSALPVRVGPLHDLFRVERYHFTSTDTRCVLPARDYRI